MTSFELTAATSLPESQPSGYETYSFRPTGLYGLIEFVRFGYLPGEMRRNPPPPGKRPVTSKSESVGFSGDPAELRAIFVSLSMAQAHLVRIRPRLSKPPVPQDPVRQAVLRTLQRSGRSLSSSRRSGRCCARQQVTQRGRLRHPHVGRNH